MSLQPGHKLAHYEIREPIGKGGMGEVYRARDGKLGRDVAIKVLPEEFARDTERLRRFQREAKVLASLNHPNIAAIYGLEQSESTHYLVLEFVPGETLAERIARGPIPEDEALEIAAGITEALEEAHERGIVHRDLKPANIMLTPDGKVKVLDFGLAKAFLEEAPEADSSMSPTRLRQGFGEAGPHATRVGVILGTAAYMSPEQAKGKKVDKRTDIFAFGAVLYEMLTGKKAFPGDDVSEVLAAVIKLEPDWKALASGISPRLGTLIRRCLEKDAKLRRRDIGDVRIELAEVQDVGSSVEASTSGLPWRFALPVLAGGMILTALAVRSLGTTDGSADRSVRRFTIVESLARAASNEKPLALSRDGKVLAYVTREQDRRSGISLRRLERLESTPIADTDGAHQLFMSPDGDWIGFYAGGDLKKVPLERGSPVTLVRDAPFGGGASWGDDGMIVFGTDTGLAQVSSSGGPMKLLTTLENEEAGTRHRWPDVLPGSEWVLFTVSRGRRASRIEAVAVASGERKVVVLEDATDGRYSPSGHLVFQARGGVVYAAPFDTARVETTGPVVPVLEGVHLTGAGATILAVSEDGTLAYYPSETFSASALVWGTRDGKTESVILRGRLSQPQLSPEGGRIAVDIQDEVGTRDVWIYDSSRETRMRLTFDGQIRAPIWTPDGASVVYTSASSNTLYRKRADGSGEPELLMDLTGVGFPLASGFSPDGKVLGFTSLLGGPDLGFLEIDSEKEPNVFVDPETEEAHPAFSPNGRWIAYESNETGIPQVYVRDFPGPGGKWQVSLEGGEEPLWSKDGRELFFRDGPRMMTVTIDGDPFPFGQPRYLFEAYEPPPNMAGRHYDVAPDGRFLMLRGTGDENPTEIHVVLNWFDELERLVPKDK